MVGVVQIRRGEIGTTRESVGGMEVFTRCMYEDQIEAREVFLPSCLTATELLRVFEVRKVFVIHQYGKRMDSAFEVVAPFLESADDGDALNPALRPNKRKPNAR